MDNAAGHTRGKQQTIGGGVEKMDSLKHSEDSVNNREDFEENSQKEKELRNKLYEYKVVASNKSVNFQCNMNEIHFET